MKFEEFKQQVIKDLGLEWENDMIGGFKDYSAEEGASRAAGFQFQIPTVSRSYTWGPHDQWYYSHIGGFGYGPSLEEAKAQSNLIAHEHPDSIELDRDY